MLAVSPASGGSTMPEALQLLPITLSTAVGADDFGESPQAPRMR